MFGRTWRVLLMATLGCSGEVGGLRVDREVNMLYTVRMSAASNFSIHFLPNRFSCKHQSLLHGMPHPHSQLLLVRDKVT
jgi:hypothetical protein